MTTTTIAQTKVHSFVDSKIPGKNWTKDGVCCFISCPSIASLSHKQVKLLQTITAGAFHFHDPYRVASGLGSVQVTNATRVNLMESAIATAFANSGLISQTPRRPIILYSDYSCHEDAQKAASIQTPITYMRLLGPKPTEAEIIRGLELFGLRQTASGWTFREGSLVPGPDGKIVGTQGQRGTIIRYD